MNNGDFVTKVANVGKKKVAEESINRVLSAAKRKGKVLGLNIALAAIVAFGFSSLAFAASAPNAAEWEKTVAAAKKEGVVSVIGPLGAEMRNALTLAFQRKYPDIKIEFQGFTGSQVGPKLIAELTAGRNTTDVLIVGTTTALEALLPAKALVPVKPFLSGPNTQDPSKWRGGKLTFTDEAQSYNLVFSQYVKAPFYYNSQQVSETDFKSWKDLLEPKWQGKIALRDPTISGGSVGTVLLWYTHPDLGKDFIRNFFALKDLALPRDDRQMLDFTTRGKYNLVIGPNDPMATEFISRGLPLKQLRPETLKEGSYITTGNGSLVIPRGAPHPNALRVYVDFFLSPEGQLEFSKAGVVASLRRDVPKDHVPDVLVPKEGTPYIDLSAEKYISARKEVTRFVKTIMPH